MVNAISKELQQLFLPQADQLGIALGPQGFGVGGSNEAEWGRARIWAGQVANGCLVTTHEVELEHDLPFHEYPVATFNVSAFTHCSLACLENMRPKKARCARCGSATSIAAYILPEGHTEFTLKAHERYVSKTVCMTPMFLYELRGRFPDVANCLQGVLNADLTPHAGMRINRIFGDIEPSRAKKPGSALLFYTRVLEVVAVLAESSQKAEEPGIVQTACDYILQNLESDLSVRALSRLLCVSPGTLQARFKDATGIPVGTFVRDARIEHACDLLSSGSAASVGDVAKEVGYANQGTFCEAFKAKTGMTPSQWRERDA